MVGVGLPKRRAASLQTAILLAAADRALATRLTSWHTAIKMPLLTWCWWWFQVPPWKWASPCTCWASVPFQKSKWYKVNNNSSNSWVLKSARPFPDSRAWRPGEAGWCYVMVVRLQARPWRWESLCTCWASARYPRSKWYIGFVNVMCTVLRPRSFRARSSGAAGGQA